MNKYLLLRDNKQTGPYTAEELVKKGIKPYDLVWLEGRSAAWRYPSEMDELAPFAPAVEEQPYDRFYKKSSSTQEQAAQNQVKIQSDTGMKREEPTLNAQQIAAQSTTQIQSISNTQVQAEAIVDQQQQPPVKTGTGKVYVTMPAGMRRQPAQSVAQTAETVKTTAEQPKAVVQQNQLQPAAEQQNPTNHLQNQQQSSSPQETIIENESLAVSKEEAKALEDRAAALAKSIQLAAAAAQAEREVQSEKSRQAAGSFTAKSDKEKAVSTFKQADAARAYADQKKAEKAALSQQQQHITDDTFNHSGKSQQPEGFSSLIAATNQYAEEKVPVVPMRAKRDHHRMLMRGIVAACLLLGGIVIGMAVTYSKQQTESQAALDELVQRLQAREEQKPEAASQQNIPADPGPAANSDYAEESELPPAHENSAIPASNTQPSGKLLAEKEKPSRTQPGNDETVTFREKETAPLITRAVVTTPEAPKTERRPDPGVTREKIFQMVKVAPSSFRIGVLGGISELFFTVSNTSSFPLDQIELEVKYLGPEKRVVKVQRLLFNDIAAGSQKTQAAPRTARGVTIDYVVTKIHSRALGIAHAGF